jgi:hypothetical protein
MYSQHSGHHHRVLRHEVMCDAYGNHFHCDDRTSVCASGCAVHTRISSDEEFGERLHELSCRISAAPHEVRALREGAEEFRPAGRREAFSAQAVVRRELAVQLCGVV